MAYKRTATFMFLKACEDFLGKGKSTKIAMITPLEIVSFVIFLP